MNVLHPPIQSALAGLVARDTRCTADFAEVVAASLMRYAAALTVRVDLSLAHATRRRSAVALARMMRRNYEATAAKAAALVTPPPAVALPAQWLTAAMELFADD